MDDACDDGRAIPAAPVDRLIRVGGAERVSPGAVKELGIVLERAGMEIAAMAVDIATRAGRATVRDSDIHLAREQWPAGRSRSRRGVNRLTPPRRLG